MLSERKNYYVIRVQTVHYYNKSCKSGSGISAWSTGGSLAMPLEGSGAKELKLSEDNCFPHTKDHRLIKMRDLWRVGSEVKAAFYAVIRHGYLTHQPSQFTEEETQS